MVFLENMSLLSIIPLVLIALSLIIFGLMILIDHLRNKHHAKKKAHHEGAHKQEPERDYLKEINKLINESDKLKPEDSLKKLSMITNDCFTEYLSMKSELTHSELMEELTKRGKGHADFLKRVEGCIYSGVIIKRQEVDKLASEAKTIIAKASHKKKETAKPKFSLPKIKIQLPKFKALRIQIPKFKIPKLQLPKKELKTRSKQEKAPQRIVPKKLQNSKLKPARKFQLPKINMPRINIPKIKIPKIQIKLPQLKMPRINLPKFHMRLPELSLKKNKKLPSAKIKQRKHKLEKLKISIPKIKIPKIKIKLPEFKVPKIKIQLPKFKIPRLDFSKLLKKSKPMSSMSEKSFVKKETNMKDNPLKVPIPPKHVSTLNVKPSHDNDKKINVNSLNQRKNSFPKIQMPKLPFNIISDLLKRIKPKPSNRSSINNIPELEKQFSENLKRNNIEAAKMCYKNALSLYAKMQEQDKKIHYLKLNEMYKLLIRSSTK